MPFIVLVEKFSSYIEVFFKPWFWLKIFCFCQTGEFSLELYIFYFNRLTYLFWFDKVPVSCIRRHKIIHTKAFYVNEKSFLCQFKCVIKINKAKWSLFKGLAKELNLEEDEWNIFSFLRTIYTLFIYWHPSIYPYADIKCTIMHYQRNRISYSLSWFNVLRQKCIVQNSINNICLQSWRVHLLIIRLLLND